jgi:hypothetical protein
MTQWVSDQADCKNYLEVSLIKCQQTSKTVIHLVVSSPTVRTGTNQ